MYERSAPGAQFARTLIPGQKPIELKAYYPHQSDYYPECELQTKRWFVENVRPDWVIFDIGANIGYYSILFSRLAPAGRVYAFEPTITFSMLEENLRHNACRNVSAMQIGVGAATGSIEENVFRLWGSEPERRVYDFSTVDELIRKLKLARLNCMKIDVDSFDFEVLMGAEHTLQQHNPWIVVELCHALSRRNQSVQEALEWLTVRGYRRAHVLDHANFVLRRHPRDLANIKRNMSLTFESRPVVLPSRWRKGAPVENLFASKPYIHNSASIDDADDSDKRPSVRIPGPRWSFATSWRRRGSAYSEQPIIVEMKLQVSGGSVGLGCVKSDYSGYVGKEAIVAPTRRSQTVHLIIEDLAASEHLVLRNVDKAGREARATIEKISCFIAVEDSSA